MRDRHEGHLPGDGEKDLLDVEASDDVNDHSDDPRRTPRRAHEDWYVS